MSSLSAVKSNKAPSDEVVLVFLAIYPSKWSVIPAIINKIRENQFFKSSLSVIKRTTGRIKIILEMVM